MEINNDVKLVTHRQTHKLCSSTSALWSISLSFTSLFWFYSPQNQSLQFWFTLIASKTVFLSEIYPINPEK